MAPKDPAEGFVVHGWELPWIAEIMDALTPRQRNVLLECCSGGTSIQIAQRLEISQSTLQNHLHAMSSRLGVSGKDSVARLVGVCLLGEYRTRLLRGTSERPDRHADPVH